MMAGQQITPTLRLVRPLGQGAMGSVWVADHLALNTQVAVKFMMPAAAQDTELVGRFRREATAAAQIKSPHVAQVFDHGVASDGSLYIVMELLEGEDLRRRIARLGALTPRDVARIISQTAKALGKAHQLGIVHRDIKPDNLFLLDLDGEPFVKVLDFGIAKQGARGELGMTATGSLLGTPFYMSPEQLLSSKHVDAHADLWALGVVGYHALTGKLPFTGETLGALAVAVNSGMVTLPSELRSGIPPAVDAWVIKALQRDPAGRFGSAKEMAEALEAAVGGAEAGRASMASIGEYGAGAESGRQVLGGSGPHGMASSGPHGMAGSGPHGMAGSGAQGRTFQGVAATGAQPGARRAPLVIAAVLLGALSVVGGLVFLATRGGAAEPAAKVPDAPAPVQAEPSSAAAIPASAPPTDTSAAASVAPAAPEAAPSVEVPPAATAATPTVRPAASPAGQPGESAGNAARPGAPPAGTNTKGQAAPRPPRRGDDPDDVGF